MKEKKENNFDEIGANVWDGFLAQYNTKQPVRVKAITVPFSLKRMQFFTSKTKAEKCIVCQAGRQYGHFYTIIYSRLLITPCTLSSV